MKELNEKHGVNYQEVAQKAIVLYAKGLLSVNELLIKMQDEWDRMRTSEDLPSQCVLRRIAQRICSRQLYAAWCSPDEELRNIAFHNLRHCLEGWLRGSQYAEFLQKQTTTSLEDVLHESL